MKSDTTFWTVASVAFVFGLLLGISGAPIAFFAKHLKNPPRSAWATFTLLLVSITVSCASTKGDCTKEPIPCHEGPVVVEKL